MAKRRRPPSLRARVLERAGGCCEYCRSPAAFSQQSFSVEHILPRSRRGRTALANTALSCQGCNNHTFTKTHGRDPATEEIVPLFHPRKHRWQDHFASSEDLTLIVGLTPTGRATVEALKLNRVGLVNLRRVLARVGEHPPP